jgi:aryl-alcohol dehydrogenase-like predicted oxidoreductase
MLSAYLGHGGNFIDTANIYTNGHSEKIIGDFFASGKAVRDRAVIATKFFANLHEGDPNSGGAGRKALLQQCEASLRRLNTDYIDLYWLHNWDRFTPIEETLRGLDDLVTAGKIRYIGFSDTPAWKIAEAQTIASFRSWAPIIAVQLEYSLLERTVEGELIPMAQAMGIGVMPWSPLKNGFLSGKYRRDNAGAVASNRGALAGAPSERDYAIIDVLLEIAAETGATPAAVALSWVQNRPGVASTVIGASRMDQLEQNLAALELTLTPAQTEKLNQASEPSLNFPWYFNTNLSPMFAYPGTTIDGKTIPKNPFLGQSPTRY